MGLMIPLVGTIIPTERALTGHWVTPLGMSQVDLAFDFQMDYGVDISVVIKNEEHFNYRLGALPFYDNVNNEGLVLNG